MEEPEEGAAAHQPQRAPKLALSLADFDLIRRLGDGSFAQVVEVRHRATGRVYALKAVDKHLVLRHKQANYIRAERALLDRLAHPGIVRLRFTFQDAASLYLGLDLCPNGELYDQIQRKGQLTLAEARFYASEIVDILAYLLEHQVVHRDLKPENLLLTADSHLRLSDFGSAKDLAAPPPPPCRDGSARGKDLHSGRRSSSLVGSADYVSPETLRNEPVGPETDLWALGCIIYQMLVGKAPFRAASEYLTFERIASGKLRVPPGVDPAAADLIKRLLRPEPAKRLGAGKRGMQELKEHAFFRGVDWQRVREQEPPALALPPPAEMGDENAEGLNWELTSMLSALPIQYSYSDSEPLLYSTQGLAEPALAPGDAALAATA
ncbi:hypothetical protein WJX81_008610 [Elliptochloris bilobata]|uniref:non-specific serine/threonine protein kinase n=1 Tax=Elliptochloris bilobata TaxID=381761 RepID=A0AAW1S7W3_9CHLO